MSKPLLSVLLGVLVAAWAPAAAANPIQTENANPGTSAWGDPGASSAEGYASETSVEPGQQVHFHVSAPAGLDYRLDIYRIGWYGGPGGRLLGCLPSCSSSTPGVPYPMPPPDGVTGEVRANWPVTDVLAVPAGWVTGYYLVRIVLSDGSLPGAIPFVVREPAAAALPSAVLVQVPVDTWQAYNAWGGKSLYDFNSGGAAANHVSFDRPYLWVGPGAQVMTSWELALVRFLEREGVDVSYVADPDVDADPGVLLRHRVVLTAGHGEYWSKAIRDAYDDARAKSTNLLFMGANTAYWQVRFENGHRTIVGYKDRPDPEPNPALKTIRFRDLQPSRPECALLGIQHYEGSYAWPRADFVTNPYPTGSKWFAGTNLGPGSVISQVVSREHDLIPPGTNCGLPLTVLFHRDAVNDPLERSESVRYTMPGSAARVFSSGSLEFSWALDSYRFNGDGILTPVNTGIQQLVRNVLADALRPAPAVSVRTQIVSGRKLRILIERRGDPRVTRHLVYRRAGGMALPLTDPSWKQICSTTAGSCLNTVPAAGTYRFAAVAVDRWGARSPGAFSGRRTLS